MKVLNILVSANCNRFFRLLVDYLIDCGHNVDIIDCADSEKWLNVSDYNLKIVKTPALNTSLYDLFLELPGQNKFHNLKKLEFNLSLIEDKLFLDVGLSHKEYYADLVSEKFNFNRQNLLEHELLNVFNNIKEAFIDALTMILRSEFEDINYVKRFKQPSNILSELISLDEKLHDLAAYNQEVGWSLPKFTFSSNFSKVEVVKQFNSKKYKFDQQKLELLAIYLLSLFNSRESAVYAYDLGPINKLISKNIAVDPDVDSYSTIMNSIDNHIYDITRNEFYSKNNSNTQKSDILVIYGNEAKLAPDYLLKIVYNPNVQELCINYHNKLYFFDALEDFIDYYDSQLPVWKKQGEILYKFLLIQNQDFYTRQLYAYNNTTKDYPQNKTIHQLFEEQSAKTPDNIAVVYENVQLTYKDLNHRANQLANYLRATYAIKGDDLIALCLNRSHYLLIAILGVLKSGGAYVPIDPGYPEDRINFILDDTQARVLITTGDLGGVFNSCVRTRVVGGSRCPDTLTIDNPEFIEILNKQLVSNSTPDINSNNLAYVIYTSGTTGKPKGVMIEHTSVINLIIFEATEFGLNRSNLDLIQLNCLLYASYIFDAHVFELFTVICHGHVIHILSDKVRKNYELLSRYIEVNSINLATIPPILLDMNDVLKLDTLVVAGDKTDKLIMDNYRQHGVDIINAYGPTETTVCATLHHFRENGLNTNIGRPISNTSCYILDKYLNPLPVGSTGELYVGGVGLARGYLNQVGLTKASFLANPFLHHPDKDVDQMELYYKNNRIYKTGDLVRILSDGDIEYIGRSDFQVKIRGFRIELNEIEMQLKSYPAIKQAVVLALDPVDAANKTTGNKYLVAYYVSDTQLDEITILSYLSQKLPDYMVPAGIKQIEKLPFTINGKLDRKALPEIKITSGLTYALPRNENEQQLVKIWAEILHIPKDSLGIFDDFFALGGNSILAIKLIYKINRELNKNLEIKALYETRNVASLANQLNSDKFIYSNYQILDNDQSQNIFAPFLLSNVQQAYYIGRSTGTMLGGVSTHVYYEVLYDVIDKHQLELAINSLINRHIILKSSFTDEFNQFIHQERINYILPERVCNSIEDLEFIRLEMVQEVIPLTQVPLFNILLSKLSYLNKYIVHFSFDALLLDAESIRVFIRELEHFYKTPNLELPKLNITFKDYREQINKLRQGELFAIDEQYWLDKLDDYSFDYNLPQREVPSNSFIPKFDRINKVISKDVWSKLVQKATDNGIGITSVILLAYGKVMSYWSGQSKFCINLTLFNRLPLHEEINNIIGDFTTLELFSYVDDMGKINDVARTIHETLWNDIKHGLYDGVDFARAIRHTHNFPINKVIAPVVLTSLLGERFSWAPQLDSSASINFMSAQTPQVWIDNKAYETPDGFMAEWDYVEQLFERSIIEAMHDDYCKLIEYLAYANWEADNLPNLELPVHDMKLINEVNSSNQEIVSATLFDYYKDYVIKHNLEENIAVIDHVRATTLEPGISEGKYSYKQLLSDSELLARYLINDSNSSNAHLVAILSEKGYNQVIGTTAIMQSGFGYLPLNVGWPASRHDEVLTQGMVNTVLLSRKQYAVAEIKEQLSAKYKLIVIEDVLDKLSADSKFLAVIKNIVLPVVKPDDIAYVIFTSGSTGVPKGVTISHRGALNTILAVNQKYHVNSLDKVLALSELSFDLSVYDIYGILAVGGIIVFPEQDKTKDTLHWAELVNKYQITIWNTVPQLAELFIDSAIDNDFYVASLRLFLLSGDWIPTNLPNKIKNAAYKASVVSLGGATEGSIWSIWYEIGEVNTYWKSIPYGMAMPNQKMYVLNHNLEHCPVEVIGEICIGGIGVALNYYNNQKLTELSFKNHPVLGRIYKTGDLGVLSRLGYIEFRGRVDSQVKINGYRIELGEIETRFSTYPGIKQSVVLALEHQDSEGRPNGNKYLAAYYVAEHKLDEAEILSYLSQELPDYMLPGVLVYLEKLPITANGKLDRKSLPMPVFTSRAVFELPRSELEKKIHAVFSNVLGLSPDSVGIHDDFFRMGGDSILSIQMVNKLRQYLGLAINVRDIFSYKTIAKLYDNIIDNMLEDKPEILSEEGILTGAVPLLPVQQWFFYQMERGLFTKAYHWNQSFLIRTPRLDINILKESIKRLIIYHDAFRFVYKIEKTNDEQKHADIKAKYIQSYASDIVIPELRVIDLNEINTIKPGNFNINNQELNQLLTAWQSELDLSSSHAYSIGYIHGYADGSSRVFFALHHLLVDVVSWRIITDDLQRIYNDLASFSSISSDTPYLTSDKNGTNVEDALQHTVKLLGLKGTSYRQWVNTVADYAINHESEPGYWQDILKDYPTIGKPGLIKLIEGETIDNKAELSLDSNYTSLLLTKCSSVYMAHINEILLSCLTSALYQLTYSRVWHILLEGHGREEIDLQIDINRTVGWFTTMYPVRFDLYRISETILNVVEGKYGLTNHLVNILDVVKESIESVPNKGIGFGAICGYSNQEVPMVRFNYLGQFDDSQTVNAGHTTGIGPNEWQIAAEISGTNMDAANIDPSVININAMVINGIFSASFVTKLSNEHTNQIAESFKQNLVALIDGINWQLGNIINSSKINPGCMNLLPTQHRYFNIGLKNPKANLATGLFKFKRHVNLPELKNAVKILREKFLYLNVNINANLELYYLPTDSSYIEVKEKAFTDQNHMLDYLSEDMKAFILSDKVVGFYLLNVDNTQYLYIIFPHFLGGRRCFGVLNRAIDGVLTNKALGSQIDHFRIIKWMDCLQKDGIQNQAYYDFLFRDDYYLKFEERVNFSDIGNISFNLPLSDANGIRLDLYRIIGAIFYFLIATEKIEKNIVFNHILHGIPTGFEDLKDAFMLLATFEPVHLSPKLIMEAVNTNDFSYIETQMVESSKYQHNFVRYIYENKDVTAIEQLHKQSPKITVNYNAEKHSSVLDTITETDLFVKFTYNLDDIAQYLLSINIYETKSSYKMFVTFSTKHYSLETFTKIKDYLKSFFGG